MEILLNQGIDLLVLKGSLERALKSRARYLLQTMKLFPCSEALKEY